MGAGVALFVWVFVCLFSGPKLEGKELEMGWGWGIYGDGVYMGMNSGMGIGVGMACKWEGG